MTRMLRPIVFPDQSGAKKPVPVLDIVVVPAIGFTPPRNWLWLQSLCGEFRHDADIVSFLEHDYSPLDARPVSPKYLLREGLEFMGSLFDHYQKSGRAVVLICHGTGGLVVKRALNICRQKERRYHPLMNGGIAGIIFLGSPHFNNSHETTKIKRSFDFFFKLPEKGGIGHWPDEDNLMILMDICKEFRGLRLNVPIISVYENKPTEKRRSLHVLRKFFGNESYVVVPRDLGILGLEATKETKVNSQLNHADVCNFPVDGEVYNYCIALLRQAIENTIPGFDRNSGPDELPLRPSGMPNHSRNDRRVDRTTTEYEGALGTFELLSREGAPYRRPCLPCFSVGDHQQNKQFKGRQDILKKIDDVLLPQHQPITMELRQIRSFAICGFGGIGKTELAVEYAYSRRKMFDAVLWLNADEPSILTSDFAQLAREIELVDVKQDFVACEDAALRWLTLPLKSADQPDLANWLIIFDNVDDTKVLQKYQSKLWGGSVLITSRDPFAKDVFRTINPPKNSLSAKNPGGIDLPPLSQEEVKALLQHMTGIDNDPSCLDVIQDSESKALSDMVQNLGGIPLAISQVSAVFRNVRLQSYTECLKYYNIKGGAQGLSHEQPERPVNAPDKVRSLATTWALDELLPGPRALLQVIALLNPDNIPESLLVDENKVVNLQGYPNSDTDYYHARAELLSSSLIKHNPKKHSLSLHRLIQETTVGTLSEQELVAAYHAACSLVIEAWQFQSMKEHHSVARFSTCDAVFPSVHSVINRLEHLSQNAAGFTLNVRVTKLINDAGWYLFETGRFEEAERFCRLALDVARQQKEGLGEAADESIRESHQFLGIILTETNDHQRSMEHKLEWLNMLKARPEQVADYELGYAYNEIGVAYGNDGQLKEAADAFRQSIKIFTDLDNFEPTMLGWPQPNLGFIYWMQKKLEEAERVLREIMKIYADKWGQDDTKSFKTGKILYALGNVLWSQGPARYKESYKFHLRCLQQYEKVLGANHHRVGDTCHRLAGACMEQRQYEQAMDYLDRALAIFRSRAYLENEKARTTFKKGLLLKKMAQVEKAKSQGANANVLQENAKALMKEAYDSRRNVLMGQGKRDQRPIEELEEEDYDILVSFWSR